jgi:hypothetical protein
MTIYKIRNKETGEFGTGGVCPGFNKHGKTYNKINTARAHIRLHLNIIKDMERQLADDRIPNWNDMYRFRLEASKNYLDKVEIVEYIITESQIMTFEK